MGDETKSETWLKEMMRRRDDAEKDDTGKRSPDAKARQERRNARTHKGQSQEETGRARKRQHVQATRKIDTASCLEASRGRGDRPRQRCIVRSAKFETDLPNAWILETPRTREARKGRLTSRETERPASTHHHPQRHLARPPLDG